MQEQNEGDPLDQLIIDSAQVNRKQLFELLHRRVWLDPAAQRVILDQGVRQRSLQEQILLALLGRKALALKVEEHEVQEAMSPKDLEGTLGAKGGSIRPALKRLADDGLILNVAGGYTVPTHVMDRLGEVFNTGE